MKHIKILLYIAMCGFASATSIIKPKITVDPNSAQGLTDNINVRCTVIGKESDKIVVVDLRTKKGFIDIGVNITIRDDSGELISTLIAPQPSPDWMAYRFTIRKDLLDRVYIELFRSKNSFRMNLRGLSVRPNNDAAEQDGADQPATAPQLKSEGKEKPKPEAEVRPR